MAFGALTAEPELIRHRDWHPVFFNVEILKIDDWKGCYLSVGWRAMLSCAILIQKVFVPISPLKARVIPWVYHWNPLLCWSGFKLKCCFIHLQKNGNEAVATVLTTLLMWDYEFSLWLDATQCFFTYLTKKHNALHFPDSVTDHILDCHSISACKEGGRGRHDQHWQIELVTASNHFKPTMHAFNKFGCTIGAGSWDKRQLLRRWNGHAKLHMTWKMNETRKKGHSPFFPVLFLSFSRALATHCKGHFLLWQLKKVERKTWPG